MARTRMEEIQQSQFKLSLHIAEIDASIRTAKLLIANAREKMAIAKSHQHVEMLDTACDTALAASKHLSRLYDMKENTMDEMLKNYAMLGEIRALYEQFEREE